jgi:hypothetical protein
MHKIQSISFKAFLILWFALVFFSYWSFHPQYSVGLIKLPNVTLMLTLLAVIAGVWQWVVRAQPKLKGWMVYGFVWLLSGLTYGVYVSSTGPSFANAGQGVFYFLGFLLLMHGALAIIYLVHMALGEWVLNPLKNRFSKLSYAILCLATGISMSFPILLFLGMADLLEGWILWIIFGSILGLRYKLIWGTLKELLFSEIKIKKGSQWKAAPIFILFLGLAIQVVATIKAWPIGFDGALLYMNTTHLLATYNGLPLVGHAFNWELFMSLGEIMFNLVPISILLSHTAIYLVCIVAYQIGRLFMSIFASTLAVVLLFFNPAFSFHALFDEKVDLGFLFIALSILLLLLEGTKTSQNEATSSTQLKMGKFNIDAQLFLWMIAGWLAGYAFGIKYTGVFAIFALVVFQTYRFAGVIAALGMMLLVIGSLFGIGVHKFAYIDLDGISALRYALASIIPGLVLLAYAFFKKRISINPFLTPLVLFGAFALLAFMPWMVRNYVQNQSISIRGLVQSDIKPPTLLPASALMEGVSPERMPERKLVQTFSSFGVTLGENQLVSIQQLLAATDDFGTSADERQNILLGLRDTIIANILTPEQRNQVNTKISDAGLSMDVDGSELAGANTFVLNNFRKRGITLSIDQKDQIKELLSDLMLKGVVLKGDKSEVKELKNKIVETILTPEQRAQMVGLKAGDLRITEDGSVAKTTSLGEVAREEVKRYMGYEPGLPLYLSLPHDLTMNVNVPFSRYLDVSFLFLLLLPFLLMGKNLIRNTGIQLLLLGIWTVSIYALYGLMDKPDAETLSTLIQNKLGIHEGWLSQIIVPIHIQIQKAFIEFGLLLKGPLDFISGLSFFWVYMALLLGGLGTFWLMKTHLASLPATLKQVLAFALALGGFWFFFGNGIIWYGFAFFALLLLWLTYYFENTGVLADSGEESFTKPIWRGAVLTSLLLCISLFFVSGTQSQQNAQYIFQGAFLRYASGPQDVARTQAQYIPYMEEMMKRLNANPDEKIFRVGTGFNYHILENDKRVLSDNQLGLYDQISANLDRKEDFIQLLKLSGFKYILYDLNTGSIDNTPEQSMRNKAAQFFNMIINSTALNPLYTDNFIRDPNVKETRLSEMVMPGVPGLGDDITRQGTFLLYEIK